MQGRTPGSKRPEPKNPAPYLRRGPVIKGRSLIPGRRDPTFPAFLKLEEKPVTFREPCGMRTREEREEAVLRMMELSRSNRKLVAVMIPYDVYGNPDTQL